MHLHTLFSFWKYLFLNKRKKVSLGLLCGHFYSVTRHTYTCFSKETIRCNIVTSKSLIYFLVKIPPLPFFFLSLFNPTAALYSYNFLVPFNKYMKEVGLRASGRLTYYKVLNDCAVTTDLSTVVHLKFGFGLRRKHNPLVLPHGHLALISREQSPLTLFPHTFVHHPAPTHIYPAFNLLRQKAG